MRTDSTTATAALVLTRTHGFNPPLTVRDSAAASPGVTAAAARRTKRPRPGSREGCGSAISGASGLRAANPTRKVAVM